MNIRSGIQFVVLVPVLVLIGAAGLALYLLVLGTIGNYADAAIKSNLEPLVTNAMTIADSEVDRQNREGKVDDPSASQVYQLKARMRFEDFARAQTIGLVIVADNAVDFSTGVDAADADFIAKSGSRADIIRATAASGREYYIGSAHFAPWQWRLYLAMDARNFDDLINHVNMIYAGSAVVLVAIAGLLLGWLRRFLIRPIYDLARQFREGHAPRYRGVKELEYLSTSIRGTLKTLRAKTLHLETTLQSMSDAITVFDADMRLVAWNQQFVDLYRYPDGFIHTGIPFTDIMSYNIARGDYGAGDPDQQLKEIVERARTLSPSRFDVDRAEGPSVEVRRARMPDGGFVTTYRDITDRKQRLRLEAANETKAQFLQNMSHDLRKPIVAIIEDARLALADPNLAQAREPLRVFEGVSSNASHLLSMIDEVLEMSRIEAGQIDVRPQPLAIAPVLDQVLRVVEPSARAKKLDIRVDADSGLQITSDRRLLSRVILNLASNAVEYTKSGSVLISARANAHQLSIEVADTGVGIAADKLHVIFDKFQRIAPTAGLTRPGVGLGLGLAISREFARLLGGDIKVSSEIGKGSVFTLTLPLAGQGLAS
jgi:signal transduction histidine kinase